MKKMLESYRVCAGDCQRKLVSSSFVIILISWGIGIVYVAVGQRVFPVSVLSIVNREDGVIEYASAILLLALSLFAIVLAIRWRRYRPTAIWHLLFGIGFLFMCGEEISWGQRIFGLETAEAMKRLNVQNENNLHNLLGYAADHLFILGIAVYGVVIPVLCYVSKHAFVALRWIGLPIASIGLACGFLLISLTHDWTVYRVLPRMIGLRIAELRELLAIIGLGLLLKESSDALAMQGERKCPENT